MILSVYDFQLFKLTNYFLVMLNCFLCHLKIDLKKYNVHYSNTQIMLRKLHNYIVMHNFIIAKYFNKHTVVTYSIVA